MKIIYIIDYRYDPCLISLLGVLGWQRVGSDTNSVYP